MQRREILNQHESFSFCAVIEAGTTAGTGFCRNLKPVRTNRNLGAQTGMASWLNAERTRCSFGMKEALQLAAIDQAKTAGRCALTIEGCGTDMAGMETVVMQGEKWN